FRKSEMSDVGCRIRQSAIPPIRDPQSDMRCEDVKISLAAACAALLGVQLLAQPPQYPQLPSETPRTFTPVSAAFDHVRRDVMIPMRDGVKLHTVILVPKGARRAPILLTRTPYDATALTTHSQSAHFANSLDGYDNALDVIIGGGDI